MSEPDITTVPLEDQLILRIAKLMQGGEEEDETCKTLGAVTKLLSDEVTTKDSKGQPLVDLIDEDGFSTILEYLDMRQGNSIRGHATLTVSAYLKVTQQVGIDRLSAFFSDKVRRGTYDDFIVAFSVAASIFPVIPAVSSQLFLSEGFVQALGPLMRRKWKSKKVEQACLEMLNAACMDTACRETIQKYCTEWLEDVVGDDPVDIAAIPSSDRDFAAEDGPLQQRVHSENVRSLAAVILAKLQAVPLSPNTSTGERIQTATTSMDELSDMFASTLQTSSGISQQTSIEGLAYASLRPEIKEKLASDPKFLMSLLGALKTSPAKSPATYGGLSILVNLTSYLPTLSEEQKRMNQLKAYANASKTSSEPDTLNDDAHAAARCKSVFDAGAIPVLVTHSQHGSPASLNLCISIIFSIAKSPKLRGNMAQQGAVRLLLHAYNMFPESDTTSRRATAHSLALILISTNPAHVFGGTNPYPLTSCIRPLLTLLIESPTNPSPSLLPTFESLLALTNLASTDDSARNPIINTSFPVLSDLLLSSNKMVVRATVELICNLVVSPLGASKYGDGSKAASGRMHVLLALADAEDAKTRLAAGGALAALTAWDGAVNAILERERGVRVLLGLCEEGREATSKEGDKVNRADAEGLRHRGVVCILNVCSAPGSVGEWGVKRVQEERGLEVLKECLKLSRSQEVLEITVEALKMLLPDNVGEKKAIMPK